MPDVDETPGPQDYDVRASRAAVQQLVRQLLQHLDPQEADYRRTYPELVRRLHDVLAHALASEHPCAPSPSRPSCG